MFGERRLAAHNAPSGAGSGAAKTTCAPPYPPLLPQLLTPLFTLSGYLALDTAAPQRL